MTLLRRIFFVLLKLSALVLLLILGVVIFSNQFINSTTKNHIYHSLETIPANRVGLVLGTSPYLRKNVPNPYFHYRISAAANLYQADKIKYLVLSGDNSTPWYNEPAHMRRYLMSLGVPDSVIYLDYAGLRTLDSVIRCREIFGQSSFTVISQEFHNQRAVFLGRRKGLDVIGFNAVDVTLRQSLKTRVREWFARVKVFYDLVVGKQPRHLGDSIIIGEIIQ
jgi:SanA protein